MDPDFIDLYDLQQQMREGLEDLFPDRLWVRAEVSAVQARANGHCYLELSQSDGKGVIAKARAVIWKGRWFAIARYFEEATGSRLSAGMQILARVQVNYSEVYGLTLVIDELEPQYTIGQAELEKRRTIEKLSEDGLLDRQKELDLASLPYSLAVISARDAAGYGDFCRHLSENEYGFVFRTDLFEATMQGDSAPASIVDALERIESSETGYDAILIMRGGGSNLDLACFDDYGLAFSIANCTIPVFTAIGHDRDHHVADMVAYASVKTPTALADEFISSFAAEDERIGSYAVRLRMALVSKINTMASTLDVLESRIKGSDPRSILRRGYLLATDSRGVVLKKAEAAEVGDEIRIMFADGTLTARITGKE